MRSKKLLMASIVLLVLLTLGAVNAAENATADNLAVVDGGGDYRVSQIEDVSNISSGEAANVRISDGGDRMASSEGNGENVVTSLNFDKFFDDEGVLNDDVSFDELIFKGEFDISLDEFVITKPLTITGDGAILKNMCIKISSDDVNLNNLTFIAYKSLGSLIYVDGTSNINLTNLNMDYSADTEEAVAIDIVDGIDINLLNNTIFFESHVINDKQLSLAIHVSNAQNVLIDRNNITTILPCVTVSYDDGDNTAMGSNNVNPVSVLYTSNLKFTNNIINSTTNNCSAEFPTIQAIYVIGCSNSILDHNNISMIDEFTPRGMDNYMYGIVFGQDSNVTFSYNNFNISTSGGKDAAGTAYAFQGIESDVIIRGNHITSKSFGPNLGVYVASLGGENSELLIEDNFINVTGSASPSGTWALVSGIEIQNGNAKIYNNTVYTYNVIDYLEGAYIYGISYAQWMYGGRSFDIQNNTVYTEGKYTISVIDSISFYADGNTLYARELCGDDSINTGKTKNVTIGKNSPCKLDVIIGDSWIGEDNTATVTVLEAGGNLTLKVNDKELVTQGAMTDNVFNYTILSKDLIFGENVIEAIYTNPNNETLSINKTATFNVRGYIDPNLTIAADNITQRQVAVINVTINPDASGVLRVNVTGKSCPVTVDDEGKGQISISDLVPGNYTATAIFESSDLRYVSSEVNTTFNVAKFEWHISINVGEVSLGNDVAVNVSIPGATGNVTVVIDGKKQVMPLENGNATYVIEKITAGNHSVVVVYVDEKGTYAIESDVIHVDKLTPNISISPIDVQYVGCAIKIAVANDTAVNVTINGKDYPVSDGFITIEEGLATGEYIVVVASPETDKYNAGSDSTTFTVVKNKSDVDVSVFKGKAGEKSLIKVNVTDGATGIVIVDVNGTKYAIDLTDGNELELVLNEGNYSVVATYGGDDRYNSSRSDIATIVVDAKQPANIRVEIASKDNLTVGDEIEMRIVADTDAKLIVMVNGIEVSSGGIENIYNVTADKAGIYNVTVIAKETGEFASEMCCEVFSVAKKEAKLNITPISDVKVGDKVTINVDNETDGALTIKVNGKTVTGEYEITKAGSYTITVESAATDTYNKGFATYTFDVAEESADPQNNMTVIVDGKEYTAEIVNGTPTVVTGKEESGNVTVVVDGVEYVAELINGTVSVTTEKIEPDNVTVVVDGVEYVAEIVNGTPTVVTGKEESGNVTVVVDGKEYSAELVNGTVTVTTDNVESGNVTVVVDGVEYVAELVNGTVTIDTGKDDLVNVTVVVDGVEYVAELVNGTVSVTTDKDDLVNVTVVVDGKEYSAELVNGTVSVTTDDVEFGNVTVVVDGKEYSAEIVNGTVTIQTDKAEPKKASEFSEITIGDDLNISFVLKDEDGNAIADAQIKYSVNGVSNTTTTDKDGKFIIAGENGAVITIIYVGDGNITGTNTTLTLNNPVSPVVVKVASHFDIDNRAITINGYAVDTAAGEEGMYYATTLLDANGKPIANAFIEFAVNNKIYNRTTYENGSFEPYKLNMVRAGRYTLAFNFAGDENYTNAFACVCVDLDKKPITIKASSKSYKTSTKIKKYTVTLSTIAGSSHDGNVYLSSGKKVTLTVNGKTYTGTTNSKGQVTFKITNLSKKAKYAAKIYFKGDKTYEGAEKSVTLTVK